MQGFGLGRVGFRVTPDKIIPVGSHGLAPIKAPNKKTRQRARAFEGGLEARTRILEPMACSLF